ncbi:cytochrome P450 [Parafrankia sp. EUN1f]|uniref:cytochrome P450 n=1 Tax=Parafrankia sp. EUN1f TaxID=102897 RepID=UPI0001C47413|nr:cytochrome P450 [Parafrankia sp. EUN1f]EFC86810.1 cytochrome P450 [Parafrankia sp. EUN1f]
MIEKSYVDSGENQIHHSDTTEGSGEPNSDSHVTLTDPDVYECPFPVYEKLYDEQPVYRDPKSGNYILTRYDDVRKALLNVGVLSSNTGLLGELGWDQKASDLFAAQGWLPMNTLVSNDPPGHRTYRSLLDKVFTAKKVASLESRVQEIIDELIDAFSDEPEIDFFDAFAAPLPMYVIAEQLGVAREDRADFKRWSAAAMESMQPLLTPQRQVELACEFVDMQQYMARAIERVRATPDDRLISRLANTETEGRLLDMRELQSLILQILVAGNETTTTTLASGMSMLLERPELAEEIRVNPDSVRPFIEETLRVAAPLQTLFRRVTTEVALHGVTIPVGSIVEVRFGAANRDPRKFPCPADVDLERKNSASHMSFGAGIHMCVGNQLARAELRLAFQTLVRRLDGMRPSRGADSVRLQRSYTTYGPNQLWMSFDLRR